MTKRDPHSDNELIKQMQEEGGTPSQGGRAGGQLQRDVGSRAELHTKVRDVGMERPTGQDDPAQDDLKGKKTIRRLDPGQSNPS